MLRFLEKNKNKLISIFTTEKIVDFKILNLFGLQILRYSFSKIINLISNFFYYDKKILNNYNNDGYLLINNFLDQNEYKKLKNEFEIIINTKGKNIYEGANENHKTLNSSINHITYDYENNPDIEAKFPSIKKIYNNKQILNTINGPNKLLQIRTKASKNSKGEYLPLVYKNHQLKDKYMAFYLTSSFSKRLLKNDIK